MRQLQFEFDDAFCTETGKGAGQSQIFLPQLLTIWWMYCLYHAKGVTCKNRDKNRTMRINEGNPVTTAGFCREPMTTSTGSSVDDSPTTPQTPLLPLATFSIEDLVYRGEGNANVVVAVPKERKVIRFRKSLPDDVSPDGGKQRAEREVEFVRFVASCFFGLYTQIPEILRYDAKDIAILSEAIQPFRPDKRRDKDIVETYATKFPDYAFLQAKFDSEIFRNDRTYCVEIKPKQGHLRDIDRKFQKCPYCLSQYYKLRKKMITCRSSYCPLDLFSGVEGRMKSALRGLLKSPQNNLKIFKNGDVVYDHESPASQLESILTEWFHNSANTSGKEYIDKFCSLICSALMRPLAVDERNSNFFSTCESCTPIEQDLRATVYANPDLIAKARKFLYFTGEECNPKMETLPNNSVLERILRMQRLPFSNTDNIYNTYLKLRPFLTDDIIYANLIKGQTNYNDRQMYCKQKKTISYIETGAKDTPTSRQATLGNINSCKHMNQSSENIALIAQSILFPMNSEKTNYRHKRSDIAHNGDDTHSNENESAVSINSEAVLQLQNYLLFSCARDCSILMSFREIDPDTISSTFAGDTIQLLDGHTFVFNVQVSDLDPKGLSCIEKHRQRDVWALNSVISIVEEELIIKNQSPLDDRLLQ